MAWGSVDAKGSSLSVMTKSEAAATAETDGSLTVVSLEGADPEPSRGSTLSASAQRLQALLARGRQRGVQRSVSSAEV